MPSSQSVAAIATGRWTVGSEPAATTIAAIGGAPRNGAMPGLSAWSRWPRGSRGDRGGGERGEADEQRGGVQPGDDGERVEARDADREQRRRQRDDAGPHDRRVPVGADAEALRHASRIEPGGAAYQSDGAAIVSWLETMISRG